MWPDACSRGKLSPEPRPPSIRKLDADILSVLASATAVEASILLPTTATLVPMAYITESKSS